MSDAGRELAELKREIVEARNQAIKTDNQVKNLTLDIKGFEKRFDGLEGRVRLSSVGVNLIVAATIALSAYAIGSVRIRTYENELAALRSATHEEREALQNHGEEMRGKLAELEKRRRLHDQAGEVALQVLTLLDTKGDKEAGEVLDKLDLAQLTALERRLVEKRFAELRHREAEAAYKSGKAAVAASRPEAAVGDLRRAIALEPEGRAAAAARYLLASSLYTIKRYDEAEPLLRELQGSEEKSVVEDAQYYLAATLARLGRRDESKNLFNAQANGSGRYATSARAYVASLESGGDLPQDLPGGRVRVTRKAGPVNQTAQASDDTGQ